MRYALDGLFIAVALWLAGIFVYLLAEFSAMTEPEEFGAHVLIFLGLAVMFGEGLMRQYRGNPIRTEAFLTFALGFGAYLIGAVVLLRGRAE
jgi:hypothetical protein